MNSKVHVMLGGGSADFIFTSVPSDGITCSPNSRSSARVVRCWVKFRNERNPYYK